MALTVLTPVIEDYGTYIFDFLKDGVWYTTESKDHTIINELYNFFKEYYKKGNPFATPWSDNWPAGKKGWNNGYDKDQVAGKFKIEKKKYKNPNNPELEFPEYKLQLPEKKPTPFKMPPGLKPLCATYLDKIADSLEDIGLVKEAYELDIIANTLDTQKGLYRAKKLVEEAGQRWEDIEIINNLAQYREAFRRYGLPNNISEGPTEAPFGIGGALFTNDDTGKFVAYAPSSSKK